MPTFQGLVTEEQLLQLIAYIDRSASRVRRRGRRHGPGDGTVDRRAELVDRRDHMETLNYLNNGHGARVVAVDEGPQAHRAPVPGLDHGVLLRSAASSRMLIRLELLTPAGDLLTSETYNKLFTLHGVVMVFFFLIPSIPAVLGNFLVPIMIGAKDLAFPRSTC